MQTFIRQKLVNLTLGFNSSLMAKIHRKKRVARKANVNIHDNKKVQERANL